MVSALSMDRSSCRRYTAWEIAQRKLLLEPSRLPYRSELSSPGIVDSIATYVKPDRDSRGLCLLRGNEFNKQFQAITPVGLWQLVQSHRFLFGSGDQLFAGGESR